MRVTLRYLLVALTIPLWAYGLMRFIEGDVVLGGILMLVAGLVFTVAASGGWDNFIEGLSNFLWGVGR